MFMSWPPKLLRRITWSRKLIQVNFWNKHPWVASLPTETGGPVELLNSYNFPDLKKDSTQVTESDSYHINNDSNKTITLRDNCMPHSGDFPPFTMMNHEHFTHFYKQCWRHGPAHVWTARWGRAGSWWSWCCRCSRGTGYMAPPQTWRTSPADTHLGGGTDKAMDE